MNPRVSIIVPVHNSKHYLKKCLSSLLAQTLNAIEIIVVLDCPTDGSDEIAESFAKQDCRIKLSYNEENLHTGLSRNRGMAEARGEYIGFHDHDDYCEPNMYELLYEKAKKGGFDVARCSYCCIYNKETKSVTEFYKYPEMPTDQWSKEWIYERVGSDGMSCVIWNHIYRTDFLREHRIQFLDSREVCSEDSIFFLEVYNGIDRLGVVPQYLYYHVFHTSNTGKVYDYRSVEHRITFFNELNIFYKENGIEDEQCLSFLSQNVVRSLYSGCRQALITLSFGEARAAFSFIQEDQLMMDCIDFLYRKENREMRGSLKPTVVAFLWLLRCLGRKR